MSNQANDGSVETRDHGQEQSDCRAALKDYPFFEVVVTGLRLGHMIDGCLRSITSQDYNLWRVHLLSDDDAENSLGDIRGIREKFHLDFDPVVEVSKTRRGKADLIYNHLINFSFSTNAVILFLDGDDRLASPQALSRFAVTYSSEKPDSCWSTYIRSDGILGHSAPLIPVSNIVNKGGVRRIVLVLEPISLAKSRANISWIKMAFLSCKPAM